MSSLLEQMKTATESVKDVRIVAVGGCGMSILDALHDNGAENFQSVTIDTDSARLAETVSDACLFLGQDLTDGFGTGGDELVASRSLNGRHLDLRENLAGSKVNILVGGLGGGTATALLPEIAKMSRSLGVLTVVVCTKPFKYEGSQKTVTAKRRMHSLFRAADSVFVINNESVVEGEGKLSASEAVKRSDAAVLETLNGLLEFFSPEKRMLLDFGTIKGQLTRGGLCGYANGISAMRNNAIEALKIAIDQFARHKSDITKAPRALIQFAIDDDVLMDGVKNAFGVAQRIFNKDAQLAMGVVFNGAKQGKTRVSIIASGLPLFNEVVDRKVVTGAWEGLEIAERPVRGTAHAAARAARRNENAYADLIAAGASRMPENENLRVLNPRMLTDEELKIPAYLRRRMRDGQ